MRKNKVRIFATWRKELCNINKVRDNHFRYLSHNFDLTLLIPADSNVGNHINKEAIHFVPVPKISGIKLIYFYLYAWLYFLRSCRQRPYHLIWAVIGEEPIGWFFRFCCFSKIKLVFDLWDIPGSHLSNSLSFKVGIYDLYDSILRKIIKTGDVIIVGVLKEGMKRFRIPSSAIIQSENGVLLHAFKNDIMTDEVDSWDSLSGTINLLYHGYLHEARGSEDAVKLVAALDESGIQARLLLVGPSDPVTLKKLRRLIEAHQLADRVKIINGIDSKKIPGLIATAHICLCPLRNIEKFRWSMPVKIYEYLAMGKPVVASNLPGVAYIITHLKNGLLYDPGNFDGFRESIELLVNDRDIYQVISQNARSSVLAKDWNNLLDDLTDNLLKELEMRSD